MKSNIEWQEWGERDPLYPVDAWQGTERGSPHAWTDAELYELGRSDWADFLRHWQHYGLNAGNCLEIGCGAGRTTKRLSDLKAAINRRQLRKWRWKPVMRMPPFDRRRLPRQLQDIGFSDIEFCMFAVQSNHDYHEFVFATKSSSGRC
jgi:hypothetical protein